MRIFSVPYEEPEHKDKYNCRMAAEKVKEIGIEKAALNPGALNVNELIKS